MTRLSDQLRAEAGVTLVEILMAMIIIAIAVVAVVDGLARSHTASAANRDISTAQMILRSYAEKLKEPVGTYPYVACAEATTDSTAGSYSEYSPPPPNGTWRARVSAVRHWVGPQTVNVASAIRIGGATVRITTDAALSQLTNGDQVAVREVKGFTDSVPDDAIDGANGAWVVANSMGGGRTFDLVGSNVAGSYVSGGKVTLLTEKFTSACDAANGDDKGLQELELKTIPPTGARSTIETLTIQKRDALREGP